MTFAVAPPGCRSARRLVCILVQRGAGVARRLERAVDRPHRGDVPEPPLELRLDLVEPGSILGRQVRHVAGREQPVAAAAGRGGRDQKLDRLVRRRVESSVAVEIVEEATADAGPRFLDPGARRGVVTPERHEQELGVHEIRAKRAVPIPVPVIAAVIHVSGAMYRPRPRPIVWVQAEKTGTIRSSVQLRASGRRAGMSRGVHERTQTWRKMAAR